jgi:hypothetical protein
MDFQQIKIIFNFPSWINIIQIDKNGVKFLNLQDYLY